MGKNLQIEKGKGRQRGKQRESAKMMRAKKERYRVERYKERKVLTVDGEGES